MTAEDHEADPLTAYEHNNGDYGRSSVTPTCSPGSVSVGAERAEHPVPNPLPCPMLARAPLLQLM